VSEGSAWYDSRAADLCRRYESLSAASVHAWLADRLPSFCGRALDVGAGSGRDAAWLASRGFDVVAVEPAPNMIAEAQRLHRGSRIQWLDDSLPSLARTVRLGGGFDLILLSAVWMHVALHDRQRAFRKLVSMLNPGGRMALTLRQGPAEPERYLYECSQAEIERLAQAHGAYVEYVSVAPDQLGRKDVSWVHMLIRLPDDGTGALPLLRNITLNDDKSSTYKLALLRVLCRVASGASGLARYIGDDYVDLPFGLVGLYWVRAFQALLLADMPQSSLNRGMDRLGFVRDGFREIAQLDLSAVDLRVGNTFGVDSGFAVHRAIRDACTTIRNMPVRYTTLADGRQVFDATSLRVTRPRNSVELSEDYLWSFGEFRIPLNLWTAFQRYAVWIEPALLTEWSALMHGYAQSQARSIDPQAVERCLRWTDPARVVARARTQAMRLLNSDNEIRCVWTDKRLTAETLDIDHCLPWAIWPCDDLWNLMPADRRVNQQMKRDRLPSPARLSDSQQRIQSWWQGAYLDQPALSEVFVAEARSTLPSLDDYVCQPDDVFDALRLQCARIRHDQQAPLWELG
jgi:SAM-dependent methyltransferase